MKPFAKETVMSDGLKIHILFLLRHVCLFLSPSEYQKPEQSERGVNLSPSPNHLKALFEGIKIKQ